LRGLREERGRTQDEVAERVGYTGKYLSEIERGLRDVPLTTLHRIVEKGLGASVGQVFSPASSRSNPVEIRAKKKAPRLPADIRAMLDDAMALPSSARRRVLRILDDVLRLADR
jgi:transcriptional regulator with XRE-family HTH domain